MVMIQFYLTRTSRLNKYRASPSIKLQYNLTLQGNNFLCFRFNTVLSLWATGEYINGECQCNPGWKGKECSLRHDECEVPDCNGHGHCTNGKCNCVRGYKGKYCEEVDCPHPTCSGHGFCAEGTCICKKGWKGADCSQMDKEALQCLPDCSGHGNFDLETQTCLCEPMWSGDDCSKGKKCYISNNHVLYISDCSKIFFT